jgi:hypothetical protein
MYGEAGILHDDEAALAVGHVLLNRGDVDEALDEFRGYKDVEVPTLYHSLARQVWKRNKEDDPTGGAKFILSHQDVQRLWPDDVLCVMSLSSWASRPRVVNETIYRLSAYPVWPNPKRCDLDRRTLSR